jgi:hypothetical protein
MFRSVNWVGAERAHANGYIGSVADDVDASGWVNTPLATVNRHVAAIRPGMVLVAAANRCVSALRSRDPRQGDRAVSDPDVVATLAAERVGDLRHQIDYLASMVALLPASPRRAAAGQPSRRSTATSPSCSGTSAVTTPPPNHRPTRARSCGAVAFLLELLQGGPLVRRRLPSTALACQSVKPSSSEAPDAAACGGAAANPPTPSGPLKGGRHRAGQDGSVRSKASRNPPQPLSCEARCSSLGYPVSSTVSSVPSSRPSNVTVTCVSKGGRPSGNS